MLVFRLVVDATGRAAILMCQTLLDPVTIEAQLVQERRACPAQIVNRERFERQALLLRPSHDSGGYAIEGRPRHGSIRIVARWQQIFGIAGAGLERNENVDCLLRKIDVVRLGSLHPLLRDRPDCVLEIDLIPSRIL